jgi:Icc-related predicted phosphoesterase
MGLIGGATQLYIRLFWTSIMSIDDSAVLQSRHPGQIHETMRILFTSDLHGLIEAYRRFAVLLKGPSYDLGVISGDLTTGFRPEEFESIRQTEGISADDLLEELHSPNDKLPITPNRLLIAAYRQKETEYKSILLSVGKRVLFIMGNDDGIVAQEWKDEGLLKNINEKRVEFGDINFVGYQYTNPFVGGIFEKNEKEQRADMKRLRKIVDSRTVLVTHGPAYGLNDLSRATSTIGEESHIGSKALRWLIDKTKPRLHLYGHLHGLFGINGKEINGAYPKERKFISINLGSGELDSMELI